MNIYVFVKLTIRRMDCHLKKKRMNEPSPVDREREKDVHLDVKTIKWVYCRKDLWLDEVGYVLSELQKEK